MSEHDDAKQAAAEATMTCDAMPNQFEGIVAGRAFYFRARWGLWRLDVAHPGYGQEELFDHCDTVAQGEHPEAGWWEEDEARAALENALRIFIETGAKK